jgi:hypothetical protein
MIDSNTTTIKCWGLRKGIIGMNSVSCSWGYSPFAQGAPFLEDSLGSYCSGNNSFSLFYAKLPRDVYTTNDVSLAGLGGVMTASSSTYAWGEETVADKIPNQGWFTQTYDNSQPIEIVMNSAGRKCLYLANGKTKCWAFGSNSYNLTHDACDESSQKLLSPDYFFSTNGYIRGIGSCSHINN